MRTIGVGFAAVVAFATLVNSADARDLFPESTRCEQPIPRNMTVYRPTCPDIGELNGAMLLPPTCSQWWVLDTACAGAGRTDGSGGEDPVRDLR